MVWVAIPSSYFSTVIRKQSITKAQSMSQLDTDIKEAAVTKFINIVTENNNKLGKLLMSKRGIIYGKALANTNFLKKWPCLKFLRKYLRQRGTPVTVFDLENLVMLNPRAQA